MPQQQTARSRRPLQGQVHAPPPICRLLSRHRRFRGSEPSGWGAPAGRWPSASLQVPDRPVVDVPRPVRQAYRRLEAIDIVEAVRDGGVLAPRGHRCPRYRAVVPVGWVAAVEAGVTADKAPRRIAGWPDRPDHHRRCGIGRCRSTVGAGGDDGEMSAGTAAEGPGLVGAPGPGRSCPSGGVRPGRDGAVGRGGGRRRRRHGSPPRRRHRARRVARGGRQSVRRRRRAARCGCTGRAHCRPCRVSARGCRPGPVSAGVPLTEPAARGWVCCRVVAGVSECGHGGGRGWCGFFGRQSLPSS